MTTGRVAAFWVVVGLAAIGVFAVPLLAGDDVCDPAKPKTGEREPPSARTAVRTAALARLGAVLASSKVTLSQAVAAAEEAAHGRAFAAELEREGGKVYYEVEVLRGGDRPRVVDVLVDLETGAVLRAADDDDDKSGKSDESEKSGKSDESEKSGKSDESGKSGKSDESGKSGKSDESGKSGKSDESEKSGKSDRDG